MKSIKFQRDRVFRDPVHGLIHIRPQDEFLLDLVDSDEFQRLHRVRQLGVANLTYPGADHTRFSHSLGVLHVASRILDTLSFRYRESVVQNLVDRYQSTIKAAALLHDVGHGPFSHLIERAFDRKGKHEERTKLIIKESGGRIENILKAEGISPIDVNKVIGNDFPVLFLQDIVSSSLDADRMDYLIRDSKYCGVQYGIYDLEWIVNCVCIGAFGVNGSVNIFPEKWRLCLDKKRGLLGAEQLIMARKHMSFQVYFHQSTRRWEAIFLCLIREALFLLNESSLPTSTPTSVRTYLEKKGDISHEEFVRIDETNFLSAFALWREEKAVSCRWLAALADAFLFRRKALGMQSFDMISLGLDKEKEFKNYITSELGERQNSRWELDVIRFRSYKGPSRSMLQTDRDGYEQEVLEHSILLSNGDPSQCAIPAEIESDILMKSGEERPCLVRIFCCKTISERMVEIKHKFFEEKQIELKLDN